VFVFSTSTKQKVNTKSSTEAELVGASEYLPHIIWVQYFLHAQGIDIKNSMFYQDDESAIQMEKNGRASAGPRSKHIHIRHFWIIDRIHQDNISLQHCPTVALLADFLTKPLQGQLFRKFRDVLLGTSPFSALLPTDLGSLSEENVEKTPEKVSMSDIARDGRITNQDG